MNAYHTTLFSMNIFSRTLQSQVSDTANIDIAIRCIIMIVCMSVICGYEARVAWWVFIVQRYFVGSGTVSCKIVKQPVFCFDSLLKKKKKKKKTSTKKNKK